MRDWSNALYGSGIGLSGFATADLDGNGLTDLLMGGSGSTFGGNLYWSVQEYQPATGSHQIRWQSDDYSAGVTALAAYRHPANTGYRVFVGTGGGKLEVFDGATLTRTASVGSLPSTISQILLADADNDGAIDLVIVGTTATVLLDPVTLARRRTIAYGAPDAAIGNVDADAEVELVYSSGYVITQKAAATTVKWDYSATGFGANLDLANIDADSRLEIIGAEAWYYLRAFDAVTKSPQWEVNADHDVDAMLLADVTGDGQVEVLYGDGQWGSIHALRASDGQNLWSLGNPEHGVTNVVVYNADSDADLELAWGAGYSSTGADYLYIHDLATHSKEWQTADIVGPFTATDIGDIDGDGKPELVFVSDASESDYADGVVFVHDAATHALKWSTPTTFFGGHAWTGVHDLKLGDTDGDGIKEIVVATDRLYDGTLYVIDGRTHQKRASYVYDSGSPLYALAIADMDGDGLNEVVAGAGIAHTGSPGAYVYVINPRTGAVIWHSHSLGESFPASYSLEVGNIDADAAPEIVLTMDRVYVFDGLTHDFWQSDATGYRALALNDWQGDGFTDIIAGNSSGQLVRLDGVTQAAQELGLACDGGAAGLASLAVGRLIFTCGSQAGLFENGSGVSWTSPSLATGAGGSDAIATGMVGGLLRVALGGTRKVVTLVDSSRNTVPVALAASATTHWRTAFEGRLQGSDADAGDSLRFVVTRLPAGGSVTVLDAGMGSFRYTPDGLSAGADSFEFKVNDGLVDSAPATVSLTRTNTVPTAMPANISVHWNRPLSTSLPASDTDADPLTWTLVDAPTHGTVTLNDAALGRITYTPAAGSRGPDSFRFSVADGVASSGPALARVTFTDQAPSSSAASYEIYPDAQIFGQLAGSDADGDSFTYAIIRQPTKGTLDLNPSTGLFTYTPAAAAIGNDSFAYVSNDGFMDSPSSQISIVFKAVATPDSGGGGALDALGLLVLAGAAFFRSLSRAGN